MLIKLHINAVNNEANEKGQRIIKNINLYQSLTYLGSNIADLQTKVPLSSIAIKSWVAICQIIKTEYHWKWSSILVYLPY